MWHGDHMLQQRKVSVTTTRRIQHLLYFAIVIVTGPVGRLQRDTSVYWFHGPPNAMRQSQSPLPKQSTERCLWRLQRPVEWAETHSSLWALHLDLRPCSYNFTPRSTNSLSLSQSSFQLLSSQLLSLLLQLLWLSLASRRTKRERERTGDYE